MTPLLTTAEVAELLGGDTTDAWVRERCADGTIPAHKIGRSWRIKQAELEKWIESRRHLPDRVDTFEPQRPGPTPLAGSGLLVELFSGAA